MTRDTGAGVPFNHTQENGSRTSSDSNFCILETGKEKGMLEDTDAVATLAVKDIKTARAFYEDTLGLTPVGSEGAEFIVYQSGTAKINVYRSQYAGTNRATAVTWIVGDAIEKIVQQLKAKGVTFEHYDMPGMTRNGDVHVGGHLKVAWFKDPDGNILNLASG
jgi:catechol 2,3-dioxygenase-like lactoylglutathione lyase family enzyme